MSWLRMYYLFGYAMVALVIYANTVGWTVMDIRTWGPRTIPGQYHK